MLTKNKSCKIYLGYKNKVSNTTKKFHGHKQGNYIVVVNLMFGVKICKFTMLYRFKK